MILALAAEELYIDIDKLCAILVCYARKLAFDTVQWQSTTHGSCCGHFLMISAWNAITTEHLSWPGHANLVQSMSMLNIPYPMG